MRVSMWLGWALLAASAGAQADIFKCVDEHGAVTYTNTRAAKGCSTLTRDLPISSVPGGMPAGAAKPATATDSSFPKVTDDAQKSRDNDRKRILNQELATEEKALEEAKKELAGQEETRLGDERNYQKVLDRLQPYKDKVELHQRNVDALKREIAGLK